jgi:DNA-binding GntR family transcriptional regulator
MIFEAIKAKNPKAAAEAMSRHIGIIRGLTDKAVTTAGLAPAADPS